MQVTDLRSEEVGKAPGLAAGEGAQPDWGLTGSGPFRCLGFRGLGFKGLGFRGLGFRV